MKESRSRCSREKHNKRERERERESFKWEAHVNKYTSWVKNAQSVVASKLGASEIHILELLVEDF